MSLDQLVNYLWLVFLASFGGLLRYLRATADKGEKVTFTRASLELCGSAFVGIVAIYSCIAFDLSLWATGAVVAIAGHEGPSLLKFATDLIKQKAQTWMK